MVHFLDWAIKCRLFLQQKFILFNNFLVLLSFSGLLSTADPDNANQPRDRQSFSYRLMGNTTGLPFVIDGEALNSTSSLNYEAQSSWNITVQSLDSGDPQLSVVTDFQISVVGK